MEVIADLHIHSHFSIATGRDADLEHLDLWGRYKGLQVVGTGDCTHPQWLRELAGKLTPAATGLYNLKTELALPLNLKGPRWTEAPRVNFVITGEVSCIYKKDGKVRKVHLLLVLPDLETAQKLSHRLGRLGNVASDGRPILGLDARFVLELVLEINPQALVIPAHIWTPWFSVLGSKSGFDSLEECFGESTANIFAVETGLSSDPAMNWRVSGLDRFALVSNSDAHSPQKLAREANIFRGAATYPEMAQALRTRKGLEGTIEFFPQEGKYHLDGHRQCGLRLAPEEAQRLGGICPKCGRSLTLGVVHRVLDLADRREGERPPEAKPFESLIALPEILGEVLGVGTGSKKVRQAYFRLLEKLGPELEILRRLPLTALAREGGVLLAHGVDRMRRGEVHIAGGYDGAYGEIRLFTPEERSKLQGQAAFFGPAPTPPPPPKSQIQAGPGSGPVVGESSPTPGPTPAGHTDPLLAGLNDAQRAAVVHQGPPLIIQAGPGTGKTRALTHRLAYLVSRRGVDPGTILALTFTRQATGEMAERSSRLLANIPGGAHLTITTFHALGQKILLAQPDPGRGVADEEQRRNLIRESAQAHHLPFGDLEKQITRWKQALVYPEDLATPKPACQLNLLAPADEAGDGAAAGDDDAEHYARAFVAYETALSRENLWDYEDLIAQPALLLARDPALREAYQTRFRHVLVDEYQDLNEAQYRLFRQLAGPAAEIMVIGDPDQAIYGFRGARPEYFHRFREDWPAARLCRFTETYRLPEPILRAASPLRGSKEGQPEPLHTRQTGGQPLVLLEAASPRGEAQVIARQIETLVGGLSHYGLEDVEVRHQGPGEKASFRDVAVLYRVHALGSELERILSEAGIPCQQAKEGVGPDWDEIDLAAERVKLLTLHAAKGLEFPYVFIAGCETGLIPWERDGGFSSDLEEEKRLFYVGLTRASRQVFLSRARERTLWGQRRRTEFSPWVLAMPPEVLRHPARPEPPARKGRQSSLFPEITLPRGKKTR